MKRPSARVREQAAQLCSMAGWFKRYCDDESDPRCHPAHDGGAERDLAWFALHAVAEQLRLPDGGYRPMRDCDAWAEAEAMLRTGEFP